MYKQYKEQWFNAKVAVVAKLQGVNRAKQEKLANQRRTIYADISNMKDQVSRDYAQIQQQDNDGVIGESARALGDRQPSPAHDPNFHHPNFTLENEEVDSVCRLCHRATMHPIGTLQCRVCSSVTHDQCLTARSKEEADIAHKNYKTIGWSCDNCDKLSLLLTPDEIDEITHSFDSMDKSRDSLISREEYENYQKRKYEKLYGYPMPQDELKMAAWKFHTIDVDNSGFINYWELLNYESMIILARRSQSELVQLLTPAEKRGARRMFDSLDADHSGQISEMELRQSHNWYAYIVSRRLPSSEVDKVVERHNEVHSRILMDSDVDNSALISWEEFLQGRALTIICSRPNKVDTRVIPIPTP